MTTLISWIGIDSRTPSSIYLASDSRISWGSENKWDGGQKLFASKTRPELFGYCGDVTFPTHILSQIVEQIDNNLFFSENEKYINKLEKVRCVVEESFRKLPMQQQRSFHILYSSRDGSRMNLEFFTGSISLNKHHEIVAKCITNPIRSGLIYYMGSGSSSLKRWHDKWVEPDPKGNTRTSRNVYSAFCDSLKSEGDPLSGGAPQLVGLYRTGAAITFGVIYNGERYFSGLPIKYFSTMNNIQWRNSLFERCDGRNMEVLKGAQKQPRPNNIKN